MKLKSVWEMLALKVGLQKWPKQNQKAGSQPEFDCKKTLATCKCFLELVLWVGKYWKTDLLLHRLHCLHTNCRLRLQNLHLRLVITKRLSLRMNYRKTQLIEGQEFLMGLMHLLQSMLFLENRDRSSLLRVRTYSMCLVSTYKLLCSICSLRPNSFLCCFPKSICNNTLLDRSKFKWRLQHWRLPYLYGRCSQSWNATYL